MVIRLRVTRFYKTFNRRGTIVEKIDLLWKEQSTDIVSLILKEADQDV